MNPFWKKKDLSELSFEEWESLCDRCGLCCRLKEEYEDTGEVVATPMACRMLDIETCCCRDYENRQIHVPGCEILTAEKVREFSWLPSSCAYRLLAEGYDLPSWHPLVTGDPQSAHKAGFSVIDRVISEEDVEPEKK